MKKKDYRYIIAILVLIIIGVVTFFYGTDKDQIVSYVSFAGTLVSIVLAIAAIIYAYYQNSVYGGATTKLNESATKIDEATTNLQRVGEFAENVEVSMRDVGTTLQELAITLPDKMENLLLSLNMFNDNILSIHQETKDEIMSFVSFDSAGNNVHKKIDDEELALKNVISFMIPMNFLWICYIILIMDKNAEGNTTKFIEWALDNEVGPFPWLKSWKKDRSPSIIDNCFGLIMGGLQMMLFRKYIDMEGRIEKFSVNEVNHFLKEAVVNRLKEEDFKEQLALLELLVSGDTIAED